jgi:hypothetical protein
VSASHGFLRAFSLPETFKLDFKDGLLVRLEVPVEADEDSLAVQYGKQRIGEYWSRKELEVAKNLSKATALRSIAESPEIKEKPGRGNQILYTYRPE